MPASEETDGEASHTPADAGGEASDRDRTHPDGCMCEPCRQVREREEFRAAYPEAARQHRHEMGRDSEPPERPTGGPDDPRRWRR